MNTTEHAGTGHPDRDRTGYATDPTEARAIREDEARAVAEIDRARADLPALDPDVFACYLGTLVRQVQADTEADPVGVLASLACAAGVYLGPGPHVPAGDDRHPLLVWPLVIGRTSAGRKGASWSTARRLLVAADSEFMTGNVRSGLTSGEGLAAMFAEPDEQPDPGPTATTDTTPGGKQATEGGGSGTGDPVRKPARPSGGLPAGDRRLLVFEPEWAAVMARMRREGNSLSATLRAAWEGGDLSTLNVSARIAPTSHIGLLAHITPGEFRAKVSHSDMAGGTYNRFLPVVVARSKFLPLAQGADPALVDLIGAQLRERLRAARRTGMLAVTGDGARLWRRLYVEFSTDPGEEDGSPVEQFVSRAAPNCLRIAGLYAALDGADGVHSRHLAAAAALVRYSIDSARSVFTDNAALTRLAAWIADAGPIGRTREEIRSIYFGRNKTAAEIRPLLDTLLAAGQIAATNRPRADGKPGKGAEVFTANPH